MDKKTFFQKSSEVILIVLTAFSFLGCSSSNDGVGETQTPDAICESPEMIAAIATNHGHAMTVSKADIDAGTKKTYTIKGSSEHYQYITLYPNDFNLLKNNSSITVTSSAYEGGTEVMHWHSVLVSCE